MSESIPAEVDAAIAEVMSGVEDLVGEETEQLRALLASYIDIISTSHTDTGRTDKLKRNQHVGPPPIKQAPRRLPFSHRQEVKDMVDRML